MRRALLAALLAVAVVASGAGVAAGQSSVTVGVDAPDSVADGDTADASLVATDVSDPEGVGSYTVNVTYDPSVVAVSATGTSTFDVSTSHPASGVLRIVGYTGDYPGPNGTVTLASLEVTGESTGTSDLDVTVETLTDAAGDDLAYTTDADAIDVTQSDAGGNGQEDRSASQGSSSSGTSETSTPTQTASGTSTQTPTDGTPTSEDGEQSTPGGTATESTTETPTETAQAEVGLLSGGGVTVLGVVVLLAAGGLLVWRLR